MNGRNLFYISLNALNFSWVVYQKQYRIQHQESFWVINYLISLPSIVMKAKSWEPPGPGIWNPKGRVPLFSAPAFTLLTIWPANSSCLGAKQDGNPWDDWGCGYTYLVKSSRMKIMKGLVRTWTKGPSLDRTILRTNTYSSWESRNWYLYLIFQAACTSLRNLFVSWG